MGIRGLVEIAESYGGRKDLYRNELDDNITREYMCIKSFQSLCSRWNEHRQYSSTVPRHFHCC